MEDLIKRGGLLNELYYGEMIESRRQGFGI